MKDMTVDIFSERRLLKYERMGHKAGPRDEKLAIKQNADEEVEVPVFQFPKRAKQS